MKEFPITFPIRIDWSEIDIYGHVNNVAFFKYVQAARVNFWETCGITGNYLHDKVGPILLSTGCRFFQPLFYPGNITVLSSIEFIKNSSYGIYHQIMSDKNELAAEAHDVIVMFDFDSQQKVVIPDGFRKMLEGFE